MIRHANEADQRGIAELLKRNIDIGQWAYGANPSGEGVAIIAEENDTVIGHIGLLPHKGKSTDNEVRFGVQTDLQISSLYVGESLRPALYAQVVQDALDNQIDFLYGFPTAIEKEAFIAHIGAEQIGYIPRLIRMNNWAKMFATRMPMMKPLAGIMKGKGHKTWPKSGTLTKQFTQKKMTNATVDFDTLWESAKDLAKIIIKRDAAFMQWRFFDHPDRHYDVIGLFADEKMVGYVVTSIDTTPFYKGEIKMGTIVDIFAINEEAYWSALITTALEQLATADVIQTWALSHTTAYQLLKREFNFRHQDSPVPIVGKIINDEKFNQEEMADIDHWYITLANSDFF